MRDVLNEADKATRMDSDDSEPEFRNGLGDLWDWSHTRQGWECRNSPDAVFSTLRELNEEYGPLTFHDPEGEALHRPAYGRTDWENITFREPDTYHITIFSIDYSSDEMDEEIATICHRVCGGAFPLLGEAAERRVRNADMIVAALNAYNEPIPGEH